MSKYQSNSLKPYALTRKRPERPLYKNPLFIFFLILATWTAVILTTNHHHYHHHHVVQTTTGVVSQDETVIGKQRLVEKKSLAKSAKTTKISADSQKTTRESSSSSGLNDNNNNNNNGIHNNLPYVKYPPRDEIVQQIDDVKWNVTGDASFLLNFSIAGFPKCGTSTMMEYLEKSPYAKVTQKERCELGCGRQAKLVRTLYEELPEGQYIRGIKCPRDLENDFAMSNYQKYFASTHFLVGMRHPIDWFQSFYNFRIYNNVPMPEPKELVGTCSKYGRNVCTHRARFHVYLANFGKTPRSKEELQFFPLEGKALRVTHTNNTIFLYHLEQLKDQDPERKLQLRKDLTKFLGLPELLPPMDVWTKPGKNLTREKLDKAHSLRLDICEEKYDHIRKYLIDQGRNSAEWILRYFLKSEDVFVSSPDYFQELALAWESDPCDKKSKGSA